MLADGIYPNISRVEKTADDPDGKGKKLYAKWQESFDERRDPHGRRYFWLDGEFVNFDTHAEDTDEYAVANNYTSVVPCQYDLTAYQTIDQMRAWNLH